MSTSDVFGTDFITDLEAARRRSLEASLAGSTSFLGYRRLEQRLPLLVRLLMAVMLLILVFLAVLAAVTANSISGLVEAVRRREVEPAPATVTPLPPPEVIADAQRFARALERLPERRRDLLARRAAHLRTTGDMDGAVAIYARIMREEQSGLKPDEMLAYADTLIAQRDLERARRILGLLLDRLDTDADRRRVIDMLLTIDLATDG